MIYTPRVVIDMLTSPLYGRQSNKMVCTKIDYKGLEISISMDSSHGNGDLARSDIRVYDNRSGNGIDITDRFLEDDESMLYGDAETLLRIMKKIEAGA
jgi:hypothetical protein